MLLKMIKFAISFAVLGKKLIDFTKNMLHNFYYYSKIIFELEVKSQLTVNFIFLYYINNINNNIIINNKYFT